MIEREALARYLAGVFHARVEILALQPLKAAADGDADPKGFGYGVPFEVERVVGGAPRSLVVSRTKLGLRKHALGDAATVAEPFLSLFRRFLDTYLTASGDAATTCSVTDLTIFSLVCTRSSRLMPGWRGNPAVMTTTSEPAVSA